MTEKEIIEDLKNTINRLQAECTEKTYIIMGISQYNAVVEQNKNLQSELKQKEQALKPFNDEYFKDLDTQTIAELAKKSIRLTRENRELEDALDEIEKFFGDFCDICPNKDKDDWDYCNEGCLLNDIAHPILNIIKTAKEGQSENT